MMRIAGWVTQRHGPFVEKNGTQIPLKFDAVVANPPYSQNWDTKDVDREKDTRFKGYGVAPASRQIMPLFFMDLSFRCWNNGNRAATVLFRGALQIRRISTISVGILLLITYNLFWGQTSQHVWCSKVVKLARIKIFVYRCFK
jgi:hypothetical protein